MMTTCLFERGFKEGQGRKALAHDIFAAKLKVS